MALKDLELLIPVMVCPGTEIVITLTSLTVNIILKRSKPGGLKSEEDDSMCFLHLMSQ